MRSIAEMFFAGSLATILALSSFFTTTSSAQDKQTGQVEVVQEVKHDTSPPLSELIKGAPEVENLKREVHPLRRIPLPPNLKPADVEDPALQKELLSPTKKSPETARNFDGVSNHFHDFIPEVVPSDTDGAVGATQYLQVVNDSFAVFDKANGALLAGPKHSSLMWKGFGGRCENDNDGDAIVLHDALANRWVFSQFAVDGNPFHECVAVSTSEDALGTYHRYSFSYNKFDDYPKLGVWPDAYYATFNMFQGQTFLGAKVCAFDRVAMLAGNAATQQCFQQSADVGGVLPANFEGGTPPPHGSPNFMMSFGSNALNLFKFHIDFQHPANSKFTGPTSIPVAAFTPLCDGDACVRQPASSSKLDSLADRLMQPLAYRNFGDHESLVVAHSVAVGSGGGIRWYEIRDPGGTPKIHQQGTFAPDGGVRWMPSIGINKTGDIAVGYSVSSDSVSPSIAFNGRVPSDPSGKLESETMIVSGGGSQTSSAGGRWGDYSSMQVDPSDDCTFWYTGEYMRNTGEFNWHTRIANFRFPGCGGGASCGKGEAYCSEKCVNINDDRDNCGQCGHNCASGKTCQGGVCKSCPAGTTFCSGECVNLQTDSEHCGACDNRCIGIGKCTGGECVTHCPGSNQMCCSGELAYCAKTCTQTCQP